MPNERETVVTIGPIGPWSTLITVVAVTTNHGRHSSVPHDHVFEVAADWWGPPAVGFPPSALPVASHDVYVVTSPEQAWALAQLAGERFARGGDEPPDLRDLAQELARRK